MDYKIVESKEIVWCPGDDRYVLIIRSNNEVIGLNYMQGDELDIFKEDFTYVDEKLMDFYNAVSLYLSGECELDRINQAIWAYFDYKNKRDERVFNNK